MPMQAFTIPKTTLFPELLDKIIGDNTFSYVSREKKVDHCHGKNDMQNSGFAFQKMKSNHYSRKWRCELLPYNLFWYMD